MPMTSWIASLSLSWLLLFGDPFSYQFSGQTDEQGQAYLNVIIKEDVGSIEVTITGDDGFSLSKAYKVRKGQTQKITWTQKTSQVQYSVKIKTDDMIADFDFGITRSAASGKQGNFELKSDRDDITERRQITYKTPFTLTNYEAKVYNTDGQLIYDKLTTDKVEAGSSFTIKWESPDEIFMVKVRGEDDLGRNAEDARVPWSLEIPHTEVIFDSGKHDIKSGEAPKVDEAWAVLAHELDRLDRANKAVNANLKAQLYIVGYTDTVGNPGDNQALSERRAKAIAQYFVDKGAWCEVWYAGMGERGLAIPTGDSVDEARNRRASYMLAVAPPAGPTLPSPGAYKRLTVGGPRMIQKLPELPPSYVEYKRKRRAERRAKFGMSEDDGGGTATGGVSDGGGSGGLGGDSSSGSGGDEGSGSASATGRGGGEGPPPVEPKSKGCSVVAHEGPSGPAGDLLALGLLLSMSGLGRRTRRRRSTETRAG